MPHHPRPAGRARPDLATTPPLAKLLADPSTSCVYPDHQECRPSICLRTTGVGKRHTDDLATRRATRASRACSGCSSGADTGRAGTRTPAGRDLEHQLDPLASAGSGAVRRPHRTRHRVPARDKGSRSPRRRGRDVDMSGLPDRGRWNWRLQRRRGRRITPRWSPTLRARPTRRGRRCVKTSAVEKVAR